MTITEGLIVGGKVYAAAEGTCVECAMLPIAGQYHCQGLCAYCEIVTESGRSMCFLEVKGARVVAESERLAENRNGSERESPKSESPGRKSESVRNRPGKKVSNN